MNIVKARQEGMRGLVGGTLLGPVELLTGGLLLKLDNCII